MAYATINKPNTYFNPLAYTGNNANGNSITGVGFQPDFVWIKRRSGDTNDNVLFDVVRGATKRLISNSTGAETTNTDTLSAFNSDGFTVNQNDTVNAASPYIAWNWKGGGTAVSNTDGSITSSVSANTTAGFSIVKYTGTGANATIGHGLGVAPKVVIIKGLSTTYDWVYGGDNIGWTKYLNINNNTAGGTVSAVWNDTAPTSSVFSVGSNTAVNQSSVEHIAYCFAEKKGFSKFGSYTGNGSDDGTFIYTGFKPAMIIVKKTSATGDWTILDNKRNTGNVVDKRLYPYLSNAEDTTTCVDFLSNGFKTRNAANGHFSDSGATFIYMAFAENPLVTTSGVPATAR